MNEKNLDNENIEMIGAIRHYTNSIDLISKNHEYPIGKQDEAFV